MKEKTKNVWSVVLAILGSIALFARLELYQGGGTNIIETVLHRFYNSFNISALPAVCVSVALFFLFKNMFDNAEKFYVGTFVLSFFFAFFYLLCTFYSKYDSSEYLYANAYQIVMSILVLAGMSAVFYAALVLLLTITDQESIRAYKYRENFFERHFYVFSVLIILLPWLAWIFGNYPGTGNADSNNQLMYFCGEKPWSTWQPPFSSVVMGLCFRLGCLISDGNLGFFIYCLLQTVVGAVVFSFGFKKLKDYGVSLTYCICGVLYFALLPVWGSFAQYFEKDLLYAEIIVLQLIISADILIKKECNGKDYILLTVVSLLAVFLRNNGIYAVIPGILLLALAVKKESKGFVLVSLAVVLLLYEGMTRLAFPAMGVEPSPISETYGILFQHTAKFVCDYPDEVTEEEKAILDENFQSMDNLYYYNPRIFDPVKIYYRHSDFKGYMQVWLNQFKRHPMAYVEATLNGAYGYLAPVDVDMGGWLQEEYDDYQTSLGIYHPYRGAFQVFLWFWNIAQVIPVLNFLCMPGLYTWILFILMWLLIKKGRARGVILLVPSFVNVLVCVASPLANAMRYALPAVASVPFLIGITVYFIRYYRDI